MHGTSCIFVRQRDTERETRSLNPQFTRMPTRAGALSRDAGAQPVLLWGWTQSPEPSALTPRVCSRRKLELGTTARARNQIQVLGCDTQTSRLDLVQQHTTIHFKYSCSSWWLRHWTEQGWTTLLYMTKSYNKSRSKLIEKSSSLPPHYATVRLWRN